MDEEQYKTITGMIITEIGTMDWAPRTIARTRLSYNKRNFDYAGEHAVTIRKYWEA